MRPEGRDVKPAQESRLSIAFVVLKINAPMLVASSIVFRRATCTVLSQPEGERGADLLKARVAAAAVVLSVSRNDRLAEVRPRRIIVTPTSCGRAGYVRGFSRSSR